MPQTQGPVQQYAAPGGGRVGEPDPEGLVWPEDVTLVPDDEDDGAPVLDAVGDGHTSGAHGAGTHGVGTHGVGIETGRAGTAGVDSGVAGGPPLASEEPVAPLQRPGAEVPSPVGEMASPTAAPHPVAAPHPGSVSPSTAVSSAVAGSSAVSMVRPRPRRRLWAVAGAAVVVLAVIGGVTVVALRPDRGGAAGASGSGASSPVAADPGRSGASAAGQGGLGSASASTRAADPASAARSGAGTATRAAAPAGGPVPAGAKPAASDEFTGATMDLTRWAPYDSVAENGSSWSSTMDRVSGGELQIVGSGKNPSGAGNVSGGACWCRGGSTHRYGIWQVRARFDAGAGYGPVIGLWPDSGDSAGWITLAKVTQPGRGSGSLVVQGSNGAALDGSMSGDLTSWHTYSVEWRPTFVRLYLDDRVVLDTAAKPGVAVPSAAMYLYVQQEVGPTDSVPAAVSGNPSQVVTHVDWVRYFT